MPQSRLLTALLVLLCLWPWSSVRAIDARLLPEGVLRVRLYESWYQGDQAYDATGQRRPLGQTGLDKLASNGVPTSVAGAYAIRNNAHSALQRTDITIDYGFNHALDLGVWIPVIAPLFTQSATLSRQAGFSALTATQQGTVAAAVARLNGANADQRALGDVFVGVKGGIVGTDNTPFRFSLGGGVRLPTGHVANPLDPHDIATGDGQWDLSLWSWTDFRLRDDFLINLHTRHDYGLPGHQDTLLPSDPTHAAGMRFQPGLHHYVQLEPQWRLPLEKVELLPSLFVIYDRQERGWQQGFDATRAAFAGPLLPADGTDWQRLMIKPTFGVNLIPSGLPMALYLSCGRAVWGRNTPEVGLVELRMDFFFDATGKRSPVRP
ncbi:MAG: hypothetical protein HQL66_14185 [Magnetococcales bacterium]|nr:hypothetical protein [Magnetococcales bacterium]